MHTKHGGDPHRHSTQKNKSNRPPGVSQGATTKKKKKKRKKNANAVHSEQQREATTAQAASPPAPPPPPQTSSFLSAGKNSKSKSGGGGGGGILAKMRQKLQGGQFRWLNERLYTSGGDDALRMMKDDPSLYEQYHQGFREQIKQWPLKPVDIAAAWLSSRPPSWVVADLGCGDATLAAAVPQRVHSFDLVACAPGVVAANLSNLPLAASSVDVAVFCLSLMGTDYGSFLTEAARILVQQGWLWIAEVQSRFIDERGKSVLEAFVAAVEGLGFVLRRRDLSNSHFLLLEFQGRKGRKNAISGGGGGESKGKKKGKGGAAEQQPQWPVLRACQYKKR